MQITMRGMGSGATGVAENNNYEGAVGFYEDGFFIARSSGLNFDLADVERIEVLRGPQGTLYGMNTTGGAINLISKLPTGEFGIKQKLDFGNRNLFRSLTAINLPKWGSLSVKLTALSSSIDGFIKNQGSGSHDFGEEAQRAGRLQLRWEPTAKLTADYSLEISRVDWTQGYYQSPSLDGQLVAIAGGQFVTYSGPDRPLDRSYRALENPLFHDKIQAHGLTLTWELGDTLTIKSLTGYRKFDQESGFANGSTNEILGFTLGFQPGQIHDHHFSQELQFIGSALSNRIRYVGGLYYFNERGSSVGGLDLSALDTFLPGIGSIEDYRPKFQSKSRAAYGQVTWAPDALEQRLEVTVGARYTKDTRNGQNYDLFTSSLTGAVNSFFNQRINTDFNSFNPAFIVNYKWTEGLRTYAKVTTGYRAGGVSFSASGGPDRFRPEKTTTYELGVKSDWVDNRIRMNADVFYNNYRDLQTLIAIGSSDPGLGFQTTPINIGKAKIKGLEVELLAQPLEDLTLNLNYSYTDAKVTDFPVLANSIYDQNVNPASPYQVGDNIRDLFVLPRTSKNSVALGMAYSFLRSNSGDLTGRVDYRWRSKYYSSVNCGSAVSNREVCAVDSYGTVDARLAWASTLSRGDRVSVSVWGQNLTDKRYKQGINAFPNTDGVLPPSIVKTTITWTDPRSFGISLGYDF